MTRLIRGAGLVIIAAALAGCSSSDPARGLPRGQRVLPGAFHDATAHWSRRPELTRPQTHRRSGRSASAPPDRLADREQIAFAVPEPGRPLTDAALARVVAVDLRDPLAGGQSRQVVLLQDDTVGPELRNGRVEVVDLPCHLGMRPRSRAGRLEQRELACPAAIAQPARPLLGRLQAKLFRIERTCPREILGG